MRNLYANVMQSRPEIIVWPELQILANSVEQCIETAQNIFSENYNLHEYSAVGCGYPPVASFALLMRKNQVIGLYSKHRSVWFVGGADGPTQGYTTFPLNLSVGTVYVAILISFDTDFPLSIDADLVLVPSHDVRAALRNHYWVSVFRAIENGV